MIILLNSFTATRVLHFSTVENIKFEKILIFEENN